MEEENIIPSGTSPKEIEALFFPDPPVKRSDDDERDEELTEEVNVFGTGNIAIDEILFPINPSLASIVAGDEVASQNLDEEGKPMKGGTDAYIEDQGEDAQNLQLSMGTKEYFSTKDDEYVDFRAEQFKEYEKALNTVQKDIKVFDRLQTLEGRINQIPITHPDYMKIKQEYEDYNKESIEKTGVGMGMYATEDTTEAENILSNLSSNAGVLDFTSINNINVPLNVNEDGYFNPDGELPEINWNPTEIELQQSKDTQYDWGRLNELTEEQIKEIQITPEFEAYAISKILEGQPEGSNMRDVFQQEGMDDYKTFMTWAGDQFKRIKMADPVLAGWHKIVRSQVNKEYFDTKRLEFENKIIKPCAEENGGVATEDCLLRHQEAASAWWNSRYTDLYEENEYVQSNTRQYAIGFSKLMNKLREPFYRTKIDVYRELDNQIEQEGYTFTKFGKDAMAKVGFSTDQTKALIHTMYTNSGVTGTTARQALIDRYNMPGFKEFAKESGLYDQAIETFRGGGGAETGFGKGGYLEGNLLNLDTAFNIVDGKITKSTLGSRDEGDFYFADKVPGGVEYVLHGGSGDLADRKGTVEITQANFQDYFNVPDDFNVRDLNKIEGARAAWEMVKQHGKAYYSPINPTDFSNAKAVVNGIDKWVVAGKAKNWFNQSAVARMYGGTGWRYGDMTIRDVFEGREATEGEEMVSSVLNYDLEQTAVLLDQTTKMLEAEAAAGFALDPDVEFDDLTSFMRHLVGQTDTMGFMYAGSILEGTGKVVSKVPGYGKPIGYGMQATGKALTVLGSLNMMAKEFTSNVVETWRQAIMKKNGGKPPTVEEFMAMASDPASDEIILKSFVGAGASTVSEKAGVSATLLGFKPGKTMLASLYRKEILKFLKQTPKWVLTTALGAGGEGFTEALQGRIHETTVNWSLGMGLGESWSQSNWDEQGFQVGWRIGLALPVAQSTISQSLVEINQVGMDVASKLIMDPSKSNSIFAPMAAANNFFKESIADIQRRIDNQSIPREEGLNAISNLSNMRNSGMKIPVTMPAEQRKQMLELLIAQNNLTLKIKETNNKEISEGNGDTAALAFINQQIVALTEQEATREVYMNKMGNVQKIVDETSKGKVKIFREKNTDAINKRIEELNNSGWKIRKQSKANAGYGDIYQKGDQQVILLNEKEILSDGMVNTGAHEFLHAVIYQTVKNSKGTAIELGNNLLTYIKQINPEALKKGKFKDRYEQYKNDETVTDAAMGEEILTLFSEAVLDGAIKLDTSMRQQVGEFFTRIIDTLMGRKQSITFNTGKDVYDFIKGYNKSIEKGKFTQAQTELLEQGATGDLIKRKYTTSSPASKSSKKLEELTEKSAEDLVAEYELDNTQKDDYTKLERLRIKGVKSNTQAGFDQIIAAGGGIIETTLNRLWYKDSLATREEFKKDLQREFVKVYDSYSVDVDKNNLGIGKQTSNLFNLRANKVVSDNIRKDNTISLSNEKAPQIGDTTRQEDFDSPSQKPIGKRDKVFPNAVKAIADNITGETREDQKVLLKNDIEEAILRVGTNPKAIAQYIVKKTKTKEYRALIKDKLGRFGSDQYIENVISLFDNLDFIKAIPVANIKRRFGKLFGIKQISTTKTKKVEDGKTTYFDKQVYRIPAVDKTKLNRIKNYFLGGEKRSQSLFEIIGEGIAVESMIELRTDKEFMKNLQDRLDFKKSDLTANQFMDEVEFNLDKRNLEDTSFDESKASKKVVPTIEELTGTEKIELTEGDYEANIKAIDRALNKIKGVPTVPVTTEERVNLKTWKKEYKKGKYDLSPEDVKFLDNLESKKGDEFDAGFDYLLEKYGAIYDWNAKIDPDNEDSKTYGEVRDEMTEKIIDSFSEKDRPMIRQLLLDMSTNQFAVGIKSKSLELEGGTTTGARKGNLGLYGVESEFNKNVPEYKWKKGDTPLITRDKYTKTIDGKSQRVDWNKVRGKDFIASQDLKLPALFKLIDGLKKFKNDSNFTWYLKALTGNVSNTQTHPFRFLMPLRNIEVDPKTGKPFNQKYIEEHTFVANNLGKLVEYGILSDQLPIVKKIINASASQAALTEVTDNKLKPLKLTSKMGKAYSKLIKGIIDGTRNAAIQGLASFIRYKDVLTLSKIYNLKEGKTMNEVLDLKITGANNNPDSRNEADNIANAIYDKIQAGDLTIAAIPEALKEGQKLLDASNKVNRKSSKKVKVNKEQLFDLINPDGTTEESIQAMSRADKAIQLGNELDKPTKGISVFDFDDTLAFSDSKVIVTQNGKTFKITPAEFAESSSILESEGATFNFDEFNKVVKGRKGPLADLALKRQEKFGSGDIFVLTARPQASAESIQRFLKGIGLDLPLSNITGLENGTPEAKALWVVDKAADGYNDFYFADDALPNVQAVKDVLSQIDVKSDVQQAKSSKKIRINRDFNNIIEQQTGKEWFKTYSKARAQVEGEKANRFEFFIPPSAEDFLGLLYKMLPKGKDGDRALTWLQDHLINPYHKGEQAVVSAMISIANDFNALRNSLDNIPKNLNDNSGYSNFTYSQALRVYMWDMQGMDIPGLSKRDLNKLTKLIEDNADMKVFAEKIVFIQKDKGYPKPQDNWVAGSITQDIIRNIQKTYRKEALQEWQQNVDIIFSEENMYKLEALYGSNYIAALKNILGRMKRGSNRAVSQSKQVENVMDWINNSVGTTMFLNRKTGLLQLISSVNFINWSDNNIMAAGKAFANQPQYWKDVMYLLNSDYLVQRRNGMRINVAESEIAEASKKGGLKGAIAYLLNKGFVFTRIADSLAIATGGATFYRNRVNSLQKQVNIDTGKLYTKAEAEAKSFDDFYKVAEESQQSSRADKISMQQASGLGRVILNYANTPMQYARIMKRSTQDLLAGRGDWKTHVSRILYYGAVQNLIFNALQQAIFTLLFDEEEEKDRTVSDKAENIGFGMLSSLLRGLGYGGALVDTLISMGREISMKEDGLPSFSKEFAWNVFDFSPSIDTKVRKIRTIHKTFTYNRKEIKRRGFSLENPAYFAFAELISAGVNIPLDRALRMAMDLKQASDKDTAQWQRFGLLVGYSSWSLNLPYWGTTTTINNEAKEDEQIETKYKNDARKLKGMGYKRIPMTKGKPAGKKMEDYIEVTRPTGATEYWLIPKK
tara:strand:- start:13 stop:9384 length:9372 start_codon:yes stop_codon:yes gene_type:complete